MIAISLGSNLGNREYNIVMALNDLSAAGNINLRSVSSLYETEPVGFQNQPPFLNAAAEIDTRLGPLELLDTCLAVERQLGRTREVRWGPRIIDIDLLIYHQTEMYHDKLILPHPCLHERRFVLEPLAEILPDVLIPKAGTPSQLLARLNDTKEVAFYRKLLLQGGKVQLGGTA